MLATDSHPINSARAFTFCTQLYSSSRSAVDHLQDGLLELRLVQVIELEEAKLATQLAHDLVLLFVL